MSNIKNLEFTALHISGNNYLSWVQDIEIHLDGMSLGHTIEENNFASLEDTAKAMVFIRRHIHEDLKSEFLTVRNPKILWQYLKDRFEHHKTVILPRARFDWSHIRIQDFKTVQEYCSAMFRIISTLRLCGDTITEEELLEKTYTTFHANDLLLQQQYRANKFTKFSELISCLMVAEQNNQVLLKNHHIRPTGAMPVPEANRVSFQNRRHGYNRGYARGRGRNQYRQNRGGNIQKPSNRNTPSVHQNWNNHAEPSHRYATPSHQKIHNNSEPSKGKGKGVQNQPPKNYEDKCFRCGLKGHWSRTCRTPKHWIDLYKNSIEKGKGVEVNLAEHDEPFDDTYLDIEDYIIDSDETFDFLTGDGKDHTG